MPTIDQLPPATAASDTDELLVSQNGVARKITRRQVIAGLQPELLIASGSLLGRLSAGVGDPEPLAVGANLAINNGTLSAAAAPFSVGQLPAGLVPSPGDLVPVGQGGANAAIPYAQFVGGLPGVPGVDGSALVVRPTGQSSPRKLADLTASFLPTTGGVLTGPVSFQIGALTAPAAGYSSVVMTISTLQVDTSAVVKNVALGATAQVTGNSPTGGNGIQTGVFRLFTSDLVSNVYQGHETIYAYSEKERRPAGVPAGMVQSSIWGYWGEINDYTNGKSSIYGGAVHELDIYRNGVDDANIVFGLVINAGPSTAASAGGYPGEYSSLLGLNCDYGSGSVAKTGIKMGLGYSVAAIDLRLSYTQASAVVTGLTAPSVTLRVSNVINFTSANATLAPVGPANVLTVQIGASAYSCTGYAFDPPLANGTQPTTGTITLATPVSVADGALNTPVKQVSHTIWMREGNDICFNFQGDVTAGSDGSNLFIKTPYGRTAFANAISSGAGIGAFGAVPPASRPVVTGSRGGATAAVLAQLLSALAAAGLVTDSTTA